MKNMGEKGAESSKVDSARALIRALSTKTKVAFHVIDRTSITINKLRDEELWPLITELIQKYIALVFAVNDQFTICCVLIFFCKYIMLIYLLT